MKFSVDRRPSRLTYIGLGVFLCMILANSGCSKVEEPAKISEFAALSKQAEEKDIQAQVKLGVMLLRGKGVDKDEAQAKKWFVSAAGAGNGLAHYYLGEIYREGLGVNKNPTQAFSWYEKAAALGIDESLSALAKMYFFGDGTKRDGVKAVEFWEKAAAKGDAFAEFSLGYAYEYGGGAVDIDIAKAVSWYEKGASHDNKESQVNLGYLYLNGAGNQKDPLNLFNKGFAKDPAKALTLFQRAADNGSPEAQYAMGHIYHDGLGVPVDLAKAVELFQKAADANDAIAQYELGRCFLNGDGVPRDSSKGAVWIQKAAQQGNADAQTLASWMYFNGEGVPKDKVLGYTWSNISAASGNKVALNNRDIYEFQLSRDEKAEGQRLASNWKKGSALTREAGQGTASGVSASQGTLLTKQSTGTAFIVGKFGMAITNHHVIDGCKEVRAEGKDGVVKVKASDAVNDLALVTLTVQSTETAPILSDPSKLRQGDEVVVFGFPLNSVLSSGGNLTPGVVSAITGLGNNTNQIQITAPIQPGSSGSPVLNKKGEVVGVVSMKLSDARMAKATGQIAQNVNFAVGGQTLKSFLTSQSVDFSTGSFRFFEKSTADLADEARKWTVMLECWK